METGLCSNQCGRESDNDDERTEKLLASSHAVLQPNLSREMAQNRSFEESVRKSLLLLQKEIVEQHNAAYSSLVAEKKMLRRELEEVTSSRASRSTRQRDSHGFSVSVHPPVDIDEAIHTCRFDGEEDGLLPSPSQGMLTPADSATPQDAVTPATSTASDRPLTRWGDMVVRALSDYKLAKRMKIPLVPALQLHPLWMTKQQTKQAGFAAASTLRLNISTALKTGDRRMGSSPLQPYIMNPYGANRLAWGLLGVLLLLWDLAVIPLTVFELGSFTSIVDWMGYVSFTYWLLDIPGSFLVGTDVEGTLDMPPGPIAASYFRSWFIPDVVIILLDIVLFIVTALASEDSGGAGGAETFRIARGLRLMRFVRLVRLHKAATIVDVIQMRMRSEYLTLVVKMLRQSMLIIAVNHYIACAWFTVSDLIDKEDTWVYVFGIKNAGFSEQYLTSFHWSLTQFAPATNNIAPQNAIERAFASCIVIYAFVAFSSFVSAVTNAANELRAFAMKSAQQEAQIRRFLGDQKVSSDLWCRIRKFCQEANSRSRMITEQDIAVFNEIPESLRIILHEELYKDFFREAHIFSGFDELDTNPQLLKRVCHFCFQEMAVHAKLDVFVDGTEADNVLVSRGGSATYWSILLENNHKKLTGDGHWLCELALWAKWSHRGQLVADSTIRFLTLNPQSFATVAASEGGSFFAYLRTLGLLLIGYTEVTEEGAERITDLTLGDSLIRTFAKRSSGFAELGSDAKNHALRMSTISSLTNPNRKNRVTVRTTNSSKSS